MARLVNDAAVTALARGLPNRMRFPLPFTPSALAALLAVWAGCCASAGAADPSQKAIIFVADQVTWQDIADAQTPNIDGLIERAAIASMSCRSAPPVRRDKAYLSIGAGNRGQASEGKPEQSYNVPPGPGPQPPRPLPAYARPGQIVNAWPAELARDNARLHYEVQIGALGDALHRAGLTTAVLGNADHGEVFLEPRRAAVTIAMDSRGVVDLGDVGLAMLQERIDDPLRAHTNVLALLARLTECLPQSDLIVIESGDTARAALSARDPVAPAPYERERKLAALERVDYLLGQILPKLDSRWLLIVLSPSPSLSQFEWMTPVIVHGPDWPAGQLTSGTTRRPGLIAAMDIAPTILSYFGLPPPASLAGRPVRSIATPPTDRAADARIKRITDVERRIYHTDRARHIFIPAQVAGAVCVALLAILYVGRRGPLLLPRLRGPVATLQLAMLAIPVACYLVHFAPPGLSALQIMGAVVAGAVVLSVAAVFLCWPHLAPVRQLCWVQVLMLVVDLWGFDGQLQLGSLYAYSPMTGARFYGLDNQAVSLLLGASIIAFATTPGLRGGARWPRLILPALSGLLLTLTIGHPQLGANTGGAIAAVVTYGTWLVLLAKPERRGPAIGLIIAAIVAVPSAFILMDVLQGGGAQTHMGHAAWQVLSGGPAAAWQIITRKLAASVSLLLRTPWSVVLVAWFAFLLYAAFRPPRSLRSIWEAHPNIRIAAKTLAVGAIVGSLVNDTGICVGTIMLSYLMFAMTFAAVAGAPASRR